MVVHVIHEKRLRQDFKGQTFRPFATDGRNGQRRQGYTIAKVDKDVAAKTTVRSEKRGQVY